MIHWLYITIQSRAVRQYSNEDVHNRGFCSDDEQYGLRNSFFSTRLASPSAFESHVTFSKCDKLDLFSISLLEYIYQQILVQSNLGCTLLASKSNKTGLFECM